MLNYFTLVALDMFIPLKLLSSDVQNIHIDNTKKMHLLLHHRLRLTTHQRQPTDES